MCTSITALADAAWPHAAQRYAASDFTWSDFDAGLLDKVRPAFPDLLPAALALALRIWSHLHGLVSLEICGRLRPQTLAPDKLLAEGLAQLIQTLDIPPQQQKAPRKASCADLAPTGLASAWATSACAAGTHITTLYDEISR
ncbi:WHG domain-containing protein [Streptomyces sp. NPDC101152]|uniref:WHG domain-containing protein n=1 Tax=Streptomyces sp. NPDC101152 TaxID=3366116 RepID=UPI003809C089